MGLFWNRNTRNIRYLCSFGSYSVFGMNGISFRSYHPDSRMNGMEGMRFTRNRQNTCCFGICLAGNPTRPLPVEKIGMEIAIQNVGAFFSKFIEIPSILLFLNRNKNSQNSPKRMHPKFSIAVATLWFITGPFLYMLIWLFHGVVLNRRLSTDFTIHFGEIHNIQIVQWPENIKLQVRNFVLCPRFDWYSSAFYLGRF